MPLTRNMNVIVAIELYNVFSKIWKLRYWYLFTDDLSCNNHKNILYRKKLFPNSPIQCNEVHGYMGSISPTKPDTGSGLVTNYG